MDIPLVVVDARSPAPAGGVRERVNRDVLPPLTVKPITENGRFDCVAAAARSRRPETAAFA